MNRRGAIWLSICFLAGVPAQGGTGVPPVPASARMVHTVLRSAGFQPAVSRVSNPQPVGKSGRPADSKPATQQVGKPALQALARHPQTGGGLPGSDTAASDPNPGDQANVRFPTLPSLVEQRRAGPAVIVHRGATAFALENSLLACALAMRHGADGVEVDLRRTRDGVLVLFHDESVDRVLRGLGRVREHTVTQLQRLETAPSHGRPVAGQVARFDDLLDLAVRCGMLLHLDLKEPGLEAEVARLVTERGLWRNVVSINEANATELRRRPDFRPLRYRAPGLYAGRKDVDPAAVQAALTQPGEMILVDDPRVAAMVLERDTQSLVSLDLEYRLRLPAAGSPMRLTASGGSPPELVERLNGMRPEPTPERLVEILAAATRSLPELTGEQRTALLVTRAWAAGELGRRGADARAVRQALERIIAAPLEHPDVELHVLDAAMAVRALGELGATASAHAVIRFLGDDDLAAARDLTPVELWRRWRPRQYGLAALGGMPCGTARRFLWDYVRGSEEEARRFGPPAFEEATRALMRQRIDWGGIAELLRSPNGAVRGTAILECVDHSTDERRLALQQAAPWALALPNRSTR